MAVDLTGKIQPKNGAFTGIVDGKEVLGGVEGGEVPDNAISESSVTQHADAVQDAQEAENASTAEVDTTLVLHPDGAGGVEWAADQPGSHASTHENGGVDEISVEGLSGVLADPQTPAAHTQAASTITDFDTEVSNNTSVAANTTHSASDGTDHANVVLNDTHRASDGTDHTYLDQDVTSTALPGFAGLDFSSQGSDPSVVEGRIWRDADGNISYHSGAGRLNLNTDRWAVCDNETGSTILSGKPVKVIGVASSGRRSIDLTDNTTLDNVERYFGIVMEDIGPGGTGKVAFKDGVAYNVDTSSWSNGSTLYLGSTPGALTDVRPSAPNYIVSVGGVLFSHATTGIIAVQEGRSSLVDSKIKQNVSTGLIYGGELSINGTNPAQFDIAAGGAVIVDAYTDPSKPLLTSVEWDEQVGVTLTNLATQTQTVIAVDKDGVFQQLSTLATPSQSRDFASLGVLLHPSLTDIKSVSDGYKNLIHDVALRELDFSASIGTFIKETGLELSANGANLKFDRAAGLMYGQGINYFVSKKDPNRSVVDADSPVTFLLGKGTGFISGTPYTDVPTDKYDPSGAGTLADIPSGCFTAHRIYYGPSSKTTGLLYGQHIYDSLKKAIENVALEEVVTSTPFTEAFVLGSIIVQQGATDLSDEFQAQFVTFGTFGDKTFPLAQETERFGEPVELLDGCSYEQQEITYLEDTGVIYADVERVGGGDITYIFGQQEFVLDCTTGTGVGGKARIALTAGASASDPIVNYIYVTRNGSGLVAQLNVSTTRPTGEFAEVGRVYLQDITTFNAEKAYVAQRYTEAKAHKDRGAVAHIKEVLRVKGATWDDGVEPTGSIDTGQTPDVVDLSVASGYVYQLHRQSFPAMQVSVDGIYIANASGSGTYTKFQKVTTLGLLETAGGSSIGTNRRFNLVVWGAVNQTAGECKLFVNLPTDDYGDDSSAYADVNGTAVVSIPREFRGVGFLIARIPVKYTVIGGGTFEFINSGGQPAIVDLRGNPPGVSGSGASGAASSFSDASFSLFNELDSSKILDFDLSGITTATTRTVAVPDHDLTLSDAQYLQTRSVAATAPNTSDVLTWNGSVWAPAAAGTPGSHATTHQDGGVDEISVAGLSGELADPQPPKTHAASHSDGSADEIVVENLATAGATGTVPVAQSDGSLSMAAPAPASHAASHHDGAADALSHTNISDIGSYSHTEIDTHIDSAANPHTVTKTQVSLGSVTDDAQLKRSANDFSSFSNKAAPVGGDVILVEDSEAAGVKKYITVGDIAGSVEFSDDEFRIQDGVDDSKEIAFQASTITTSTVRTITMPDKDVTLDDANDARTPSTHASSHADAGSDELTVQDLGSGAAVVNKILETDGTGGWNLIDTPAGGGGNVSSSGTPADNQLAVWTDASTIEGDSGLYWNGSYFQLTGILDVTNNLYVGGSANVFSGDTTFFDQIDLAFGNDKDAYLRWDTYQTPGALNFTTKAGGSNLYLFTEYILGADYGHAAKPDPHVIVHSSNNSTTEWISISHDQTDGNIEVGDGTIKFKDPDLTSALPLNNGSAALTTTAQDIVGAINELDGPVDHGALTGKDDDDHTQYSLAAGTRAFTGVVGGVTPTADAHLATKGYVDSGDEPAITTVSSSTHTVVLANKLVHVTYTATGAVTITIDSDNAVNGRIFKIIDGGGLAGTNNITINTEGSETINGENSVVINGNYDGVEIYSDGTNFFLSNVF